MPRHVVRLLSATVFVVSGVSAASAQEFDPRHVPLAPQSAASAGSVLGVVRDDHGGALADVTVLAVGAEALPFLARSNAAGEFLLALPPGDYVLRAVHADYISSYREPVRVQGSTPVERNIVLTRKRAQTEAPLLFAASAGLPVLGPEPQDESEDPEAVSPPSEHTHDATAWRLRHLKPTALRDVAERGTADVEPARPDFEPRVSVIDWIMVESARAAASYFSTTDFTGQVNFLTASSLAADGEQVPTGMPHGIAYLAVGAPVGSAGDWSVRGALSARALASWVVMAEYTARTDLPHAFRTGVSYSSQPTATAAELSAVGPAERVRSVGGMYGYDRWQLHPRVEVDYGLRLDRYDYVKNAEFVSPRAGVRIRVLSDTRVTLLASQYVIAPGANEFLPPASAGPWVPPERTFSPLRPGGAFRAERVREIQIGIEQTLAASEDPPVVAVQRFRESTRDQLATLFGLDAESGVGHYYVASPGSVSMDGWIVRLSGRLLPGVSGSVAYTTSTSEWDSAAGAADISPLVPSVARAQERLHDVTTALSAVLPETATRVRMAYRLNTAFSAPLLMQPSTAGRFNVEVRQGLPWRLIRGSQTELVMVFRNLFRDLSQPGSRHDELLTVVPPMRVMGGVQLRF